MTSAEENNVMQFPAFKGQREAFNANQSREYMKASKAEFCDEVVEYTMEQVFYILQSMGALQDGRRVNEHDVMLIGEALESLLHRYYGIEHDFHDLVAELYKKDETEQ